MSGEQFELDVIEARDAGRIRMRLRGEFDLAGVAKVSERLRMHHERREPVLLDLDELEFIDMSGLRVVLTAAKASSRDGWPFAVTRGSSAVRRLLALVGVDGQLPVDLSAR